MYYFPGKKLASMQKLTLFLLSCLFLIPLSAQVNLQELDRYIADARSAWEVPGMAVAIVKDGEVVLAKGYGSLHTKRDQAVDQHSLFAIASNTKAFVATAIGMLVEEGKLNWDDPVRKHLPYFELYDPCVTEMITVKDLLCHRAGLGTFSGDVIWYKSELSAEQVIQHAAHVPQAFAFRDGYGYSNLMFITAGEVIRSVTGKSWAEFVQERIFEPLNMSRTITSVDMLVQKGNAAQPHKPVSGKNIPIEWVNWDNMGAAGGIISSVSDMAHWLQLQLNHGIYRTDTIFEASTQEKLWTPNNSFTVTSGARRFFPGRQFSAYGLGWSLADYQGRLIVSHGGGYDGMYSRVLMAPEEELGIVVLTNSMKGISTWLCYHILDEYFGNSVRDWQAFGLERQKANDERRAREVEERRQARLKDTNPALPLEEYAGRYTSDMFGPVKVREEEDKLLLHFPNAPHLDARLPHWHLNTFEIDWYEQHAWFDFGTLQFILDNNGKVQELQFDVPNDDIFFHEIKAKKEKD